MTTPIQREYVFRRIYPDCWGLFADGRCVVSYRPTGRVYRVTLFFPNSNQPYRQVLVSSQRVAREVALELAETVRDEP